MIRLLILISCSRSSCCCICCHFVCQLYVQLYVQCQTPWAVVATVSGSNAAAVCLLLQSYNRHPRAFKHLWPMCKVSSQTTRGPSNVDLAHLSITLLPLSLLLQCRPSQKEHQTELCTKCAFRLRVHLQCPTDIRVGPGDCSCKESLPSSPLPTNQHCNAILHSLYPSWAVVLL